jgi:uncharacterized protein YjbI with pentapeptide repeats
MSDRDPQSELTRYALRSIGEARKANPNHPSLREAILDGASLPHYDLSAFDLRFASLIGCDLRGATLPQSTTGDQAPDLSGAHRFLNDQPIKGWRNVGGRLVRDE